MISFTALFFYLYKPYGYGTMATFLSDSSFTGVDNEMNGGPVACEHLPVFLAYLPVPANASVCELPAPKSAGPQPQNLN
jgi:hypothetical protein